MGVEPNGVINVKISHKHSGMRAKAVHSGKIEEHDEYKRFILLNIFFCIEFMGIMFLLLPRILDVGLPLAACSNKQPTAAEPEPMRTDLRKQQHHGGTTWHGGSSYLSRSPGARRC
jgi:hypothetical protein